MTFYTTFLEYNLFAISILKALIDNVVFGRVVLCESIGTKSDVCKHKQALMYRYLYMVDHAAMQLWVECSAQVYVL